MRGVIVRAYCMASFLMVVVASRKRVSWGAILRNTTLEMDDLPLLRIGVSIVDKPLGQKKSTFSNP